MSFRLKIVDDESLTCSKSGPIWGRIYFENGDRFFPEQGWTDMVVAFSNAWVEALVRMAMGASREETIRFIDGPFQVTLSATDNSVVEVRLVHKETIEQSTQVMIEDLLQNSVSSSKVLLGICQQRGWFDDADTQALAGAMKRGEELLAKLKK